MVWVPAKELVQHLVANDESIQLMCLNDGDLVRWLPTSKEHRAPSHDL